MGYAWAICNLAGPPYQQHSVEVVGADLPTSRSLSLYCVLASGLGCLHTKNIDRDLRVRLLKRSKWPPVYIEEVQVWSVAKKEAQKKKLAFLLPHEIVGVLSEAGEKEALVATSGLDKTNLSRHKMLMEKLGTPFVSLSLWGDGVPFSWDRKRSVDVWTLSFPGLSQKLFRDMRVCLTAVAHEFMLRECQDDIMAVLSWSLSALSKGQCPDKRRDGSLGERGEQGSHSCKPSFWK